MHTNILIGTKKIRYNNYDTKMYFNTFNIICEHSFIFYIISRWSILYAVLSTSIIHKFVIFVCYKKKIVVSIVETLLYLFKFSTCLCNCIYNNSEF